MKKDYKEEIIAIKALLDDVLIASYATVNEDGTPHNTPLMLIHDESFKKEVGWARAISKNFRL